MVIDDPALGVVVLVAGVGDAHVWATRATGSHDRSSLDDCDVANVFTPNPSFGLAT